jgi:xanthine dehydrogenase D subunit
MTQVGARVARPDVPSKIDGTFTFSNDLAEEGMLFGATVRSPHAHARLLGIDASHLDGDPAVVRVLTAVDVPGDPMIGHIARDQPVFAIDVVRYHGEPVAFVVARTQEAAWRAVDRMVVSYDPRPVLDDPERALQGDAPQLHPGGNLVRRLHLRRGAISAAEVEVEGTFHTARQDQAFLAPESAVASLDPDGGIRLRLATQDLHADQHQIATALGLPLDRVRLEMAGVGGAFGGREDITLQVHLSLAALLTGQPVKTTYRRGESFLAHPKRHPTRLHYRLGADRDGTLRCVTARILLDGGAYASTSGPVVGSAAYFAAGPYRVPAIDVLAESVYTNNPISGAMRGFGAVQACFAMESAMDLLAAELGMDAVELRRRNALRPGDEFPTSGQRVGNVAPVRELIDRCVALPLPPTAQDDADPYRLPGGLGDTTRGEGVRRGVGFALGVKNHLYAEGVAEHATATVVVDASGIEVRSAAAEVGQGVVSAMAQIASDAFAGTAVRVATASTDHGYAGSSSASRATFISGGAVRLAAADAADRLRAHVAERWSVPASSVELDADGVMVRGERVPLAVALGDESIVATATFDAPVTEPGDEHGQGDVHIGWMFVAHRAVVDVDVDLGLVKVVQVATAQDVGRQINPREVRGQIDGGVAQGLGLAVMEQLESAGGLVRNATFTDYLVPTAADIARTEVAVVERPDPAAPLGLKGVGEPPSLSSTPSIVAAIRAATGRRLARVPVRPDDIAL